MSVTPVENSNIAAHDIAAFREIVLSSAFEMFAATGREARHSDVPELRHPRRLVDLCGVIAFMGTRASGNIALRVSREFAEQTHPLRKEMELSAPDVEDWLGELCNQLMGRVKNRFISRGLDVQIGIPRVATGTAMELTPHKKSHHFSLHFDVEGMGVDLSFDIVGNDGGTLLGPIEQDTYRDGSVIVLRS